MAGRRRISLVPVIWAGVIALTALTVLAARAEEGATVGPVTGLPMPRFVSLKAGETNVRRGPSLTHRIDWVFTARGMPLEVVDEYGHWRQVRDRDGVGGWVHYTLLSGLRTGLVETDLAPLHARADTSAPLNAQLEAGVIVALDRCGPDWCRAKVEGKRGWMLKTDLWGAGADEEFE